MPLDLDRLRRKVVALADASFDFSRASSFSSALDVVEHLADLAASSIAGAFSAAAASLTR